MRDYSILDLTWGDFKSIKDAKDLSIQEHAFSSQYSLSMFDGPMTYQTTIKIRNPRTTDQIDYEDNYQADSNAKLEQTTEDNRKVLASNRVKSGYTQYVTGKSDDIANGLYGEGSKLKLDSSTLSVDLEWIDHIYAVGGRVRFEGCSMEDELDVHLIGRATTAGIQQAGDYTKTEVAPGANIILPVSQGTGDWDINLTETLNAKVPILKCTPIPVPGNNGWFNYDKKNNVLTRNMTQTGGYNLYDFEIKLHRFGNTLYGSAQDGFTDNFESADLVGKLLYNTWLMRFDLTKVSSAPKMAVMMTMATKKNVN